MTPEQQKEFFSKTFTLQGRMFFTQNVLTPEQPSPEDAAKGYKPAYKIMFVWPKTSNAHVMQELGQFITTAKDQLHASIPWQHFVNPIKDYDTYVRQDGKPNHEFTKGCYWINASTQFQPPVVGPDRQPVINEADVYSGRNCVINISFYNMSGTTKDGKAGKRGLSTNFNAVMLLEGGEREGGGGVQVDPNQVFGQFQVDMGLVNQGGPAPSASPSSDPFGGQQHQAPAPQGSPFGGQPQAPAPTPQQTPPPQQGQPNPFGQGAPAPVLQGQPQPSPFGGQAPAPQAPAGQFGGGQQVQMPNINTNANPFGQ